MSFTIPSVMAVILLLLGGGLLLIPPETAKIVGIICISLAMLLVLWCLIAWVIFRIISKTLERWVVIEYNDTNFHHMGETSPFLLFNFKIHNSLPLKLEITSNTNGDLRNPAEALSYGIWKGIWSINTQPKDAIPPKGDSIISIKWYVPTNYLGGPMAELAFRANDTKVQHLSFGNMSIELEARIFRIRSSIGWLYLKTGDVKVNVPWHPIFDRVRKEYNRARGDE